MSWNLVVSPLTQVPYHKFAIVADRPEELSVMQVELNVLDDVGMACVCCLRLEGVRRLRACSHKCKRHRNIVRKWLSSSAQRAVLMKRKGGRPNQ